MTAFTVGEVKTGEEATANYPVNTVQRATVAIVDEGVHLDVIRPHSGSYGTIELPPDKARELGWLLIKAAERHGDLVEQVKLIEQQRADLAQRQESLITELMR